MADYSDLMMLEKKPKPTPPSVVPASENIQSASLLANQQTSKSVSQQVSKPANQHTSKSANQKTSKEVNQQTSESVRQHAGKEANQQTSKQLKKIGSYLREESIKALKQIAVLTDRKDYEILQDAVDFYLEQKQNR